MSRSWTLAFPVICYPLCWYEYAVQSPPCSAVPRAGKLCWQMSQSNRMVLQGVLWRMTNMARFALLMCFILAALAVQTGVLPICQSHRGAPVTTLYALMSTQVRLGRVDDNRGAQLAHAYICAATCSVTHALCTPPHAYHAIRLPCKLHLHLPQVPAGAAATGNHVCQSSQDKKDACPLFQRVPAKSNSGI
jgi:hypothetical protein